ncbi:MAG TPA: TAT-variant-translocated molybdopterin oxidoreductase, partial [Thermoanaerobaculia bacterium]|nr:TAT-variant-translocated molybdopterin oxidoreductase [Thermoanaerobaculia bacterium]
MDSAKGAKAKCAAEPSRPAAAGRLDLETVRRELREKRGPEFWRSLDELAGTPEFQELLHREFPRQASEWVEPAGASAGADADADARGEAAAAGTSRRAFLQLSSASLALAGLTACTR